ncbi:MAG: hypothetical protein Q7S82_03425 [bacterium]|nr:hypothetical protein [bacterium]
MSEEEERERRKKMKRVVVYFLNGKKMTGATDSLPNSGCTGFLMTPERDKTERVFVSLAGTRIVRWHMPAESSPAQLEVGGDPNFVATMAAKEKS